MLINECSPRVTPDGNLRFSMPGFERSFGEITPWDRGFDTRLYRDGTGSPSHLWALTLFPARPARALPDDVQAFIDRIPAALRERVKQFAFGQALMLRTLARSVEAADLFAGHPTIFWLMIAAVYDARIDPNSLERLSRAKQVDILRRLVDSRSRALLRLLRKIDVDEGTLGDAHDVIRALGNPELARAAAHQRRLHVRLLRALTTFPTLVQPALVRILADDRASAAVATLGSAEEVARQVTDIGRMATCLDIDRPEQALARCSSVADIRRLHDRWVERLNRRRASLRRPATLIDHPARLGPPRRPRRDAGSLDPDTSHAWIFPAPPFPDSSDIVAIRNFDELRQEGVDQRNCVASYAAAIVSGRSFVYRVLHPQRATLELTKTPAGWAPGQLKLAGNAAPGQEVRHVVQQWFERCQPDEA